MPHRFENGPSGEPKPKRNTSEDLRKGMEKAVKLFCKEFSVEGKEGVEQVLRDNPNAKFVVAASHFSNLDAPAAVQALGDILDMQITAESVLFEGLAPQRLLFKWAGSENFVPLSYEKGKKGKHGVFDPDDFTRLAESVEQGKTPWIAIHPFTTEEKMQEARIGSVYLAHKTGAMIIPAALEYEGGSISMEGGLELAKALASRVVGKGKGTYHVGKPIQLQPLDVSIIETVKKKRTNKENVTDEERVEFFRVSKRLREDANTIAGKIGTMLPPERRGRYQEAPEMELDDEDIIQEPPEAFNFLKDKEKQSAFFKALEEIQNLLLARFYKSKSREDLFFMSADLIPRYNLCGYSAAAITEAFRRRGIDANVVCGYKFGQNDPSFHYWTEATIGGKTFEVDGTYDQFDSKVKGKILVYDKTELADYELKKFTPKDTMNINPNEIEHATGSLKILNENNGMWPMRTYITDEEMREKYEKLIEILS